MNEEESVNDVKVEEKAVNNMKVEEEAVSDIKVKEEAVNDIKVKEEAVSDIKVKEEAVSDIKVAVAISDLENKIIRQVEYYFGNYNLGRDKFLREQIMLDDGWIPMETIAKFKRLKSLSEDFSVIIQALKKSPAQLMEVSEDGAKIRRRLEKPLPVNSNSRQDEIEGRTIYAKGFKPETSLDELLDFFKPHKVENIMMRRRPNKAFKGSVYITFDTKEDADTFFALKDIKYGTVELLREYKKDYCKRKAILHEQVKKEKELKKKKKAEQEATEPEIAEHEIKKGCLIKLTGLGGKGFLREHIKANLESHGTIVFVDYAKGQLEAVVRFETPVAASVVESAATENEVKVVEINSEKIPVTLIEGEEEVEYWKTIAKSRRTRFREKSSYKNQKNQWNKGRFNKKNRGKRQNDEKQSAADEESEEPTLKQFSSEEPQSEDAKRKQTAGDASEGGPPQKKVKSESDEPNGHIEKADSEMTV